MVYHMVNCLQVRQHLHQYSEPSYEVNELRTLLRAPHVQVIVYCSVPENPTQLFVSTIDNNISSIVDWINAHYH